MGISMACVVKDNGGGLPIGLIRFVMFAPMGIYQDITSKHWNVIRSHLELRSGIYGTAWATGERLADNWGSFGFYWNFVVWFPAMIVPPPFSLVFGIIDMAIAVMISISTNFQTGYSPHNIDRCGGTGAHNWQLPAGANESFFEASTRLNATATNAFQMCRSYVLEWRYGIVISFFYSIIALVNIVICCGACVYHYRESKKNNKSFARWLWDSAIIFPKIIVALVWVITYYIPAIIFRCLPIKFKAKTRYARRYTAKTGFRAADAAEMQLEKLAKKVPMRKHEAKMRYKGGVPGVPANLTDFLGIYDMLMLVVEDLHYADILNLSLTSKSVRECVLPAEDYDRRLKHFRMYTCEPTSKAQCWVCTNQICKHCTYNHTIKQTTPYHHLDLCNPYCTPCYKSLHLPSFGPVPKDPPFCRCAPPTPSPNIFQRMIRGSAFYTSKQTTIVGVTRPVCKQCAYFTEADVLNIREKRTEWELRDKGRGVRSCSRELGGVRMCTRELGGGVRWWVCGKCGLECRAVCHRAWQGREEAGKDEVVVGAEAV